MSSKRGSLEISITAVVVLIIAIVMLGLGLTFIRSFFGGTVAQLGEITERLDDQTREELLTSKKQITFLSRRVKVEGREKSFPFAIRNIRPNTIEFAIEIKCFDAIGDESVSQSAEDWVSFQTFRTVEIEGGKSDVMPLQVSMDAAAVPTIYKCIMEILIENEYTADGSTIQPSSEAARLYVTQRFEIDYKK